MKKPLSFRMSACVLPLSGESGVTACEIMKTGFRATGTFTCSCVSCTARAPSTKAISLSNKPSYKELCACYNLRDFWNGGARIAAHRATLSSMQGVSYLIIAQRWYWESELGGGGRCGGGGVYIILRVSPEPWSCRKFCGLMQCGVGLG